jgi:hypothetical protein
MFKNDFNENGLKNNNNYDIFWEINPENSFKNVFAHANFQEKKVFFYEKVL